MTATTDVQADHRELLLQAYAAYNSQDVEACWHWSATTSTGPKTTGQAARQSVLSPEKRCEADCGRLTRTVGQTRDHRRMSSEDAFDGLWQIAVTPGDRRDDLRVTYRRR